MEKGKNILHNNLDKVTINIVNELGSLGVYKYNKLTYLFEYLFIKNFGLRYTKEMFIKFPHGPVIKNYKKVILNQSKLGVIDVDVDLLLQEKKLINSNDDYNDTTIITKRLFLDNFKIPERTVYDFLLKVLDKYGNYSVSQLEEVVYNSTPVKKFLIDVKLGYKKECGGYILDSNGIKLKEYITNDLVRKRQNSFKHELKYPYVDTEQQNLLIQQFSFLENLRPNIGEFQ